MQIRAVLFDLDDTIILDEAATRAAFESTAQRATRFGAEKKTFLAASLRLALSLWKESEHYEFCQRIGINDAECLWGEFGMETSELRALGSWSRRYRLEVFDMALREQFIENPEAAQELAHHFSTVRRKEQKFMPDALETLARLKKEYLLGLLTNGAPVLQQEKIKSSSLELFFEAIVVSGDHPVGKPDPQIFAYLLDQLQVQASEAIMVGNSQQRDIAGAHAAGIISIWFQVPGAEEPADCHPDFTIQSLAELPPLLKKIQTSSQE